MDGQKKVNKALAGTQLEPWLYHTCRHCVSGKIKGIADINRSEPKLHKSQNGRAAWYHPNGEAGITNGQHLLHYWSGSSSSEPVGINRNFCSICTKPKISVKAPSVAMKIPIQFQFLTQTKPNPMGIKPAKHLHESTPLQTIKVLSHQTVFTPCVKSLLGSFGAATAQEKPQ